MANDLEKQVLRLIGESVTSPDAFGDISPIRESVGDCIQELNMLTGGYRERYRLPMVADKSFYRVYLQNGEVGWVVSAWMLGVKWPVTQTSLLLLNRWDPRWLTRTGRPERYFPIGNNAFGLYPKPSATDDVLELDLVVIPAHHATDTYRLKIRDSFRYAVVQYAVGEYWASVGDARRAEEHHALYLKSAGLMESYIAAGDWQPHYRTTKSLPDHSRPVTQ